MTGDEFLAEDGRVIYFEELRIEKLVKNINVYNLEIEALHTYYVANGILIHNMCQIASTNSDVADEIYNADRTGSALKSAPSHRARAIYRKSNLLTEGQLDGIFEYIMNDTRQVTHQIFINGGTYTGTPNQRVPRGGHQ